MRIQIYRSSLQQLKCILLGGEVMIMICRFISQILFPVPSIFQLFQIILATIIFCRKRVEYEALFYIAVALILIYMVLWNIVAKRFGGQIVNSFTENFMNNYDIWGYFLELPFRVFGVYVAWRSLQLTLYLDNMVWNQLSDDNSI